MEYIRQYEILQKKAKSDLAAAKILLENREEFLEDETILFHIQQSIEKILKAIIAYNGIHFQKTHNTEILFDKCRESGIDFIEKYLKLSILDDYAVEGRYEDIGERIENIKQIIDLVEQMEIEACKYISDKN